MASLRTGGGGRRAPFDRRAFPVHLNDRTNSVPRLIKSPRLQAFIFDNIANGKMRWCSSRTPCRRRGCPWCALSRVAAKTRRDTRDVVSSFDQVLDIVLSTSSVPTLAEAWVAQSSVRSKFMANAWLSDKCDGWLRETEITVSGQGWHVHDHLLVFLETNDPADLAELGARVVTRWLDSSRRAAVVAVSSGQHHKVHSGTHERLLYVTKGLMVQKHARQESDGYSMGDVLAMFEAGDADAATWWAELNALFLARRRWRAKGGKAFRRSADANPENHLNDQG